MLEVCETANLYPELSHPKAKLLNFAKMISDFRENMENTEENSLYNETPAFPWLALVVVPSDVAAALVAVTIVARKKRK